MQAWKPFSTRLTQSAFEAGAIKPLTWSPARRKDVSGHKIKAALATTPLNFDLKPPKELPARAAGQAYAMRRILQ